MNAELQTPRALSKHVWLLPGPDQARFPSGNSLVIVDGDLLGILDTNPGYQALASGIGTITDKQLCDVTDILLTHTHLDHGRGLAAVFEDSKAKIHAHPDTLSRCERAARVGLYAGIPPEGIHHFQSFGSEIGFIDRDYPNSSKIGINDGECRQLGTVSIIAHETWAHAPHVLDYELVDGDTHILFTHDYDFSPVPWYGIPQRGDSIPVFMEESKALVARNPDLLVSSHRAEPISPEKFATELNQYLCVIMGRTERAVQLLGCSEKQLGDLPSFVYPVEKMTGKYSKDYIYLAGIWDKWLLLAHLEHAWALGLLQCTSTGNDPFLEDCLEFGACKPRTDENDLHGIEWANKTLQEHCNFQLPMASKWVAKKNKIY